jgi:CheY-like chemotaxis protein/HPt (histidine-containing phosphotransfer) domain-containing protein
VLVAEDNEVNQQVALELLEALGCEVELANDGEAAIAAVQGARYDAVLMDCQMPRVDGYQATAAIRGREGSGRRVPILAVTAHAMAGDREKALSAGMDDYVTKPLTSAKLVEALGRWVRPPADADTKRDDAGAPPSEPRDAPLDPGVRRSARVAALFLGELSRRVDELRRTVGEGDARAIKEQAHTLKGSSLSVGANALAKLCAELEVAPPAGRGAILERLQAEAEAVGHALRREVDEHGGGARGAARVTS